MNRLIEIDALRDTSGHSTSNYSQNRSSYFPSLILDNLHKIIVEVMTMIKKTFLHDGQYRILHETERPS